MLRVPLLDLWRAVRQRDVDITETSLVKVPTTDTLINASGQEWRDFRRSKLIPYSAYALGGVYLLSLGFTRYEDIKNSNRDVLQQILSAAGSRYKMHEPKSWPEQSELAAKGTWDKLNKLQNEILNKS